VAEVKRNQAMPEEALQDGLSRTVGGFHSPGRVLELRQLCHPSRDLLDPAPEALAKFYSSVPSNFGLAVFWRFYDILA
jgi:hypothetical protein